MVELAVVPTGAVGLLEVQDRDVVLLGEMPHVAAEPVADLLDHDRRGDGLAQMVLKNRSTCPPTWRFGT